jgi:predicted transcriptional regulator
MRTSKESVRRLRGRLGINQKDFWLHLGVTQSGGSRYESGSRTIPKHMKMLIELIYGDKPLQALKRMRDKTFSP